jgi:hypothetical protein
MKAMIERLKALGPAAAPFEISPGATVIDPVKFHTFMVWDAEEGPRAPRCRTGAFQQDLKRYLEIRANT